MGVLYSHRLCAGMWVRPARQGIVQAGWRQVEWVNRVEALSTSGRTTEQVAVKFSDSTQPETFDLYRQWDIDEQATA